MIINRNNINEIVNNSGAKPDKDYGQNFLIDTNTSERIVNELSLENSDLVLEIGPGLGSLTHYMYENCNLEACDIDERMINFLKIIYPNLPLIHNDIRKIDISKYEKIIGNLPYNITTELVTHLLINAKNCKRMVLMCQQEAFARFYDKSGKEYSAVSVLTHLLGTSKPILVAKPGAFYPAPKCSSLVFGFDYYENIDREKMIKVYKMAKSLFLNRRKTILNNLKNYLNDSQKANEVLIKLGIEANKRPEEISSNQYLEMYNLINK